MRLLVDVSNADLSERLKKSSSQLGFQLPFEAHTSVDLSITERHSLHRALSPFHIVIADTDKWDHLWSTVPDSVIDIIAPDATPEQIHQALQRASHHILRERNRSDALGHLAHDVNNPLAAIRILAETLQAEAEDDEARQDAADLLEATDAASLLVDTMHNASKYAAYFPRLSTGSVLIQHHCEDLLRRETFRGRATILPGEEPIMAAGEDQIWKAILTELFANARRLTIDPHKFVVNMQEPNRLIISTSGLLPSADDISAIRNNLGVNKLRASRIPVNATGLALTQSLLSLHDCKLRIQLHDSGVQFAVEFPPNSSDSMA